MAVEVVGEAADQKLRVNCGNCLAVLEYVRADIQSQTLFDMAEYSGNYHYVTCPRCRQQIAAKR